MDTIEPQIWLDQLGDVASSDWEIEDDQSNISTVDENNRSLYRMQLSELPIDMQFNEGHKLAIIGYSILMIFSAVANISVFCVIIRTRFRKVRLSRISLMLLHLVTADLLVTLIMMPLEIIWNATVSWEAGDFMCRLLSFFRIFGLFLSGFVLVCISIDRYFAIVMPLQISKAKKRGKIMLTWAWIASGICSLPQSFIFHVESHPVYTWYEQCVTFNSFPEHKYELMYNFFGLVLLYGVPLITILFCYTCILYKIYKTTTIKGNDQLRRSNMGALGRAKIRTVKMTIVIVATFFLCWTPCNVMSLWYWFDKESAQKVDQRVQKILFLFACTNSCVNPLIYGYFHFRPVQCNRRNVESSVIRHSFHQYGDGEHDRRRLAYRQRQGQRQRALATGRRCDTSRVLVRWQPNTGCPILRGQQSGGSVRSNLTGNSVCISCMSPAPTAIIGSYGAPTVNSRLEGIGSPV